MPTKNQYSLLDKQFATLGGAKGIQTVLPNAGVQTPAITDNLGVSLNDAADQKFSLLPGVSDSVDGPPDVLGNWTKGAGIASKVAGIGLGVYNAFEQSKMNDFMRGYYNDRLNLQKTDFTNAARGANEALASKQQRVLSAQGVTTGTDANKTGVANYMKKWGATETV